jgi:dipeptidyl aminopeptidase/acylaminoacyl peptidase
MSAAAGCRSDQDGHPLHPVPMITLIHGGPSDERAQLACALAAVAEQSRYGVFYMNSAACRGSARNSSTHSRASGGAMNRDVDEQVERLDRRQGADPKKIAVLGGSYGGRDLTAITQRADLYKCAIDVGTGEPRRLSRTSQRSGR